LRQGMARSLATLYAEFFCRLWKELLLHPFEFTVIPWGAKMAYWMLK
jgi:hypothetical protein